MFQAPCQARQVPVESFGFGLRSWHCAMQCLALVPSGSALFLLRQGTECVATTMLPLCLSSRVVSEGCCCIPCSLAGTESCPRVMRGSVSQCASCVSGAAYQQRSELLACFSASWHQRGHREEACPDLDSGSDRRAVHLLRWALQWVLWLRFLE